METQLEGEGKSEEIFYEEEEKRLKFHWLLVSFLQLSIRVKSSIIESEISINR